jgi:DNA-binding NtrC family response regulator
LRFRFSLSSERDMASFLLVDGDRNFREALAIALRLDGHAVIGAATAEDALARLEREAGALDCCLVDAHLWDSDAVLDAAARAGVRTIVTGPHAELLEHATRRHPRAEPLAKPFGAAALTGAAGADPSGG